MGFLLVLGLIAWVAFALWPAFLAKRKGYSFILFMLLGIFLTFLVALIIAAIMPDKTKTAQDRADDRAVELAMEND